MADIRIIYLSKHPFIRHVGLDKKGKKGRKKNRWPVKRIEMGPNFHKHRSIS